MVRKNILHFGYFQAKLTIVFLSLIVLALPATALPTPAPLPFAQNDFQAVSERAEQTWQELSAAAHQQPIQSACEPFRLPAQGRHQGTVILLHGFTACPQQFWDISPKLAAAGFDVYVPLLPGHGRSYRQSADSKIVDNLADMPSEKQIDHYTRFADQLSGLVQDETGRKVMSGLSVGGGVAAAALVRHPGLYDRGLLITPLLDISYPDNYRLPLVNAVLPRGQGGWGPGCELERNGGRGGYCQFQLTHVRATQLLGKEALEQFANLGSRVQIVGVENDGAANNQAIASALKTLPFASGCLYPKGANHSLLSLFDAPHETKFWMKNLHQQLLTFIQSGIFFDTEGISAEHDIARCS